MFAIICNARKGSHQGVTKLALVDRNLSRKLWWTSDRPSLIESFVSEAAAEARAEALSRNAPRVVTLAKAKTLIAAQASAVKENAQPKDTVPDMDDADLGWDAHKT